MPRHHLLHGAASLMVVATVLLAGCGGTEVIDADARPIVERVEQATPRTTWTFEYLTLAASPYVACLGGIDEVAGAVDVGQGVVALQPARAAPEVLVTASTMLVPQTTGQLWHEVALDESGIAELTSVFGEVLAGFIRDGIHRPDLNSTVLGAIDIASSVSVTAPPFGLRGDAMLIELDEAQYVAELAANAPTPPTDPRSEITPSITATVDASGLVTGLAVTLSGGTHGDGYVMTASYADPPTVALPDEAQRVQSELGDLNYPDTQESCRLGS